MNKQILHDQTILITGSAGFIGFHLASKLLEKGIPVIGLDNLNPYYDQNLKRARLSKLISLSKILDVPFEFHQFDLENIKELEKIFLGKNSVYNFFKINTPSKVVNLAAQAGVRYSLENPKAYVKSNIEGFLNILECSKNFNIKHLIYASSSSVYGGNKNLPFKEDDIVDHPISLYAATKKSNELMAHTYSHLFGLPTTGLRFFTVYGPWGRPDMALFLFTKAILEKQEIKVFNNGNMVRDFTYIDDVVQGLIRVIDKVPLHDNDYNYKKSTSDKSWAPFRIFNIGNSESVNLMQYIKVLENELGIEAQKKYMPVQPGDVVKTLSDTRNLEDWIGFKPNTSIEFGVKKFVTWYRDFYKI